MSNVQVEVQSVFAEVTRYPLEILDPQANLEQDLGIDSVKLGEVLSVLRERFQLPLELEIAKESLMTITGVTKALAEFLGRNGSNGSAKGHAGSSVAEVGNSKSNGKHTAPPLAKSEVGNGHVPRTDHPAQVTTGVNGAAMKAPVNVPQTTATPGLGESLDETIRNVFAEVTRYPGEILDPEAGLEDDLGIDSVKLGEVFSVLRERFNLPAEPEIPRENLRSISAVTAALRQFITAQPKGNGTTQTLVDHIVESGRTLGISVNIQDAVISVFAEVTRYPKEILDPKSDLEQDLGIDSVKLGEVFSVLRERYRVPEQFDIPREKLRTIHDIADGLRAYVTDPAAVMAPPAPAAVHTNGGITAIPQKRVEQPANAAHRSESLDAALYSNVRPSIRPFSGKVVFVSGSGRGLGKDIADYLADLGASVVVNSFHSRSQGELTAEEIRKRGGDAIHIWGSMANPEHVSRVFDEIEARHGHLDFFISNASNGMLARLEEITVEHWEKAYRTNVIGLHQSALRAVRLMRRRGGGKIITLSSPAAHGYVDYFGCMGAVKAAVESLTRSMAIEFASYNIQVNCISPGPVYGELLNKWPDSERLVRQWENNTAYDRLCEARDVSHFIGYLLSEPVRLFTGSVLIMDGGISSQGW